MVRNFTIAIIVICVLLIAYSPLPIFKIIAIPLVFFICGLGLCFESKKIHSAGEVKARIKSGWTSFYRERLQQDSFVKYITIKRDTEPLRFYSYVIAYGLFGAFCVAASVFYLLVVYKH
jgi:hypothetical protein